MTTATVLLPRVIPLDHRHRITSHDGTVVEAGAFLAGSHDAVGMVEADGFSGVQVDLAPLTVQRVLGGDVAALAGRVVALDALFGAAGTASTATGRRRGGDAPSWMCRVA